MGCPSVDTVTPIVTITSPVAGTLDNNQPLLEYAANDGVVTVKVDGNQVSTASGALLNTMADGNHTVRVEARDTAGNIGYAEVAIYVDAVAPIISISSPVVGATNNTTPLLAYTVDDGSVMVKVDGIVVAKAAGSTLDQLADGIHTVRVESTDTHNRTGFAEVTFTVDTAAPVVTMTSPASGVTNNATPTLSYMASDGTVKVKVDGAEVSKVSGNTLAALSDGSHTVRVEASDIAGNIGYAEATFTVDTIMPIVVISSPAPGTTNFTSMPLIYMANEGNVTVKLDGGVISTVSGGTLAGLENGSHTVRVESKDSANNTGFAEVTFTVDPLFVGNDDNNIYCKGTGTYVVGPSSFASGIIVPPAGSGAVAIASPYNGATISGSKTIVKGAMDTTVPVNSVMIVVTSGTTTAGYLAQVNGNYFAAKVPVSVDTTTISAIATDQTGTQHQATVSVSVAAQAGKVDLMATPSTGFPTLKESGTSSLDVNLLSTPTITYQVTSYTWDFDGSGTNDLTCYSHANLKVSYAQAGLYLTETSVADSQGNSFTDTEIVNVLDYATMDAYYRQKWNSMKSSLASANGNFTNVLSYFAESSKDVFNAQFTALAPYISQIVNDMSTFNIIKYISPDVAEGELRTMKDGYSYSFQVIFTRDSSGNWLIRSF